MEIIKVKIKKSYQVSDWYNKEIGNEFEVIPFSNTQYFLAKDYEENKTPMRLINIDDCEIIEEKALRYNQDKRKWSLVHFKSLEPMVEVLEYGCKKYAPYNWQKGLDKKEILESMQRHLIKLFDDERLDEESKLQHIGHIMCNCMFYSYFDNNYGESKKV